MEIIKTENFDTVVNQPAVVVDFFAEWCGPCKMIMPVLEQLSQEYAGKVTIVKVNVDDDPELAKRFDVTSIPNLCAFKNGQLVNRTIGYQTKDGLTKLIESVL